MPKSRRRKPKQIMKDASGKPFSKKGMREAQRKITMRHMALSQACESLKASEIEELINSEPFGGTLDYIQTKLDENGVPVDGETKQLTVGGSADKARLERILENKIVQEAKAKEQTEA